MVEDPVQAIYLAAVCPVADAAIMAMIAIMRKTTVTTKDKSPYGIAKHGFFLAPVKHPRQATITPIIPMASIPPPIAFPASVNPGI